jgi:pyruvate-ferredoxin/flavodoxin oxidoreductase
MTVKPRFPGIRVTANGNQLVSYHTETRIADAGVFYPITPSTEGGELYQQAFSEGKLNVFGQNTIAVETEGEHAAQGGAIAHSVCGKRVVNYTSGQGVVYGVEQYYHAPGKCSTMVLEVGARALTKHALNVHCGHDDVYGALDTGWIIVFGKDAQQAADQALILRRVTELSLTPGMNVMDGFLTTHLERTFYKHESQLIREYLGAPEDIIECPTDSQRILFGRTRRRVPKMIDLTNPVLLGPVQNQEHYMQGVVARRNNFVEPILEFFEAAYKGLRGADGSLLRAGESVQDRGRRHRVRVAGVGRREYRGLRLTTCERRERPALVRFTSTSSVPSRKPPSSMPSPGRRTSSSSSDGRADGG